MKFKARPLFISFFLIHKFFAPDWTFSYSVWRFRFTFFQSDLSLFFHLIKRFPHYAVYSILFPTDCLTLPTLSYIERSQDPSSECSVSRLRLEGCNFLSFHSLAIFWNESVKFFSTNSLGLSSLIMILTERSRIRVWQRGGRDSGSTRK